MVGQITEKNVINSRKVALRNVVPIKIWSFILTCFLIKFAIVCVCENVSLKKRKKTRQSSSNFQKLLTKHVGIIMNVYIMQVIFQKGELFLKCC